MDADSEAVIITKCAQRFLPLRASSGERAGVRCKSFSKLPRQTPPPARNAAPFHPAHACASGHTARTIACRWDIIPRPPVRPLRRDATLQQRKVSIWVASQDFNLHFSACIFKNSMSGENFFGSNSLEPSNLVSQLIVSFELSAAARSFGENFTTKSFSTHIRCRSKARSCRAFKQSPFFGFRRFFSSSDHGMI